jgi:hypothetical protein
MQTDLWDIPVYRISEKKYYEQRNEYIEKRIFRVGSDEETALRAHYKLFPHDYARFADHLARSFGGMWRYNEIVGYIRIHFFGGQIRGEYIGLYGKRIVRSRRKLFEIKTHKLAAEITVYGCKESSDIFRLLQRYINDCKKELKGRFVDDSIFHRIGAYVDWEKLFYDHLNIRNKRIENVC